MSISQEDMKHLAAQAKCVELYEVTQLHGIRNDAQKRQVEVDFVVLDRGEGTGPGRFYVTAEDDFGRIASGNPAGTLREAVANVHWHDLDEDVPDVEDDDDEDE